MKSKWIPLFLVLAVVAITMFTYTDAAAQCAMCTLNAENGVKDGNTIANGLNDGIIFLLAIPYLVAIGVGILWYKKYRKNHTKKVSPFGEQI